ncbi:MAG: YegS/Rv2252/BmrU family lipid kinase [Peptococcaceae bacterium]|nr:YegS/Rv2252/BmrU family lipid kinase [Peptococcaceae bacterium]
MYYFIVNQTSGRGRAAKRWHKMKQGMLAAGVPFREWRTRRKGDATALAQAASRLPDENIRLVVVGGDGTINEVINGIDDFERVALGVVPAGSGNDFARGLGMARSPFAALAQILASDGRRRIDLGEVRLDGHAPRRFGISAGVGMDAWVCEQVDKTAQKAWLNRLGIGQSAYLAKVLPALGNLQTSAAALRFSRGSEVEARTADSLIFLAAMNFPWEGGGVKLAPGANARDGLLTVRGAMDLRFAEILRRVPGLLAGCAGDSAQLPLVRAEEVSVALARSLVVHADGEVLGRGRHVTMRTLPRQLRVLI